LHSSFAQFESLETFFSGVDLKDKTGKTLGFPYKCKTEKRATSKPSSIVRELWQKEKVVFLLSTISIRYD
jgi:hypothetical protein